MITIRSLVVVVGLLRTILCLFVLMWGNQFRTVCIVHVLLWRRSTVSFTYWTLVVVVVRWRFRWGVFNNVK